LFIFFFLIYEKGYDGGEEKIKKKEERRRKNKEERRRKKKEERRKKKEEERKKKKASLKCSKTNHRKFQLYLHVNKITTFHCISMLIKSLNEYFYKSLSMITLPIYLRILITNINTNQLGLY
jgi:hypothetical protein